jgi:dephospho-CoA kinase
MPTGYSQPSMERRLLLLTGGIGSGKSEVGKLLVIRGACVIDADRVGHKVLDVGGEAFAAVCEAFPEVVVDGVIDRARLATEVFADPTRLRLLESLTHPAIRRRIHRMVEQCDDAIVVVEIPLLTDFLGPGWQRIVVDAPESARLERLVARGMRPIDVKTRMAAQPSPEEWREAADYLIDNSGSQGDLVDAVDALWDELTINT